MLKRKARRVEAVAKKVKDERVSQMLMSDVGKLVIVESIREELVGKAFDGLNVWIEETFEKTPDGYVFKGDYQDEVREFLQQIDDVERELQNDDF